MCPLCKHGLGGKHHQRKLNKPLAFIQASTSTSTHMGKEELKKLIPNNLRRIKDIKDMGSVKPGLFARYLYCRFDFDPDPVTLPSPFWHVFMCVCMLNEPRL